MFCASLVRAPSVLGQPGACLRLVAVSGAHVVDSRSCSGNSISEPVRHPSHSLHAVASWELQCRASTPCSKKQMVDAVLDLLKLDMREADVESVLAHEPYSSLASATMPSRITFWSVVHSSTLAPPGPALSSHHVAIAGGRWKAAGSCRSAVLGCQGLLPARGRNPLSRDF